ncbi:hypothetical protein EB093_06890 [bacterium]|nr:hypothetical protein [bacterium]
MKNRIVIPVKTGIEKNSKHTAAFAYSVRRIADVFWIPGSSPRMTQPSTRVRPRLSVAEFTSAQRVSSQRATRIGVKQI